MVTGNCGYVPSETLSLGRKNYAPYAEVTKMHQAYATALG
jgi:hypothetical protein